MSIERPQPFRVDLSGVVLDQLRGLLRAAAREGRWDEVAPATEALDRALTWTPEIVGEPVYDLPILGRVQIGSFGPIQLRIAVNEDRRIVFVSYLRLLPRGSD